MRFYGGQRGWGEGVAWSGRGCRLLDIAAVAGQVKGQCKTLKPRASGASKPFLLIGVPDEIRTRVIAVKGRCPGPG